MPRKETFLLKDRESAEFGFLKKASMRVDSDELRKYIRAFFRLAEAANIPTTETKLDINH